MRITGAQEPKLYTKAVRSTPAHYAGKLQRADGRSELYGNLRTESQHVAAFQKRTPQTQIPRQRLAALPVEQDSRLKVDGDSGVDSSLSTLLFIHRALAAVRGRRCSFTASVTRPLLWQIPSKTAEVGP